MMPEDDTLTSDCLHELADRASIIGNNIDDYLCKYRGLKEQYPEIHELAEKAESAVWEFYHTSGAVMFALVEKEKENKK